MVGRRELTSFLPAADPRDHRLDESQERPIDAPGVTDRRELLGKEKGIGQEELDVGPPTESPTAEMVLGVCVMCTNFV